MFKKTETKIFHPVSSSTPPSFFTASFFSFNSTLLSPWIRVMTSSPIQKKRWCRMTLLNKEARVLAISIIKSLVLYQPFCDIIFPQFHSISSFTLISS
jgi:hypothetical protein